MSEFIAALPMYDWPETRAETDAEWLTLRDALRSHGIDAPERLTRRNGDLPPVSGGIRDGEGRLANPATLPPDELDFQMLWRHPNLLIAQTCWGPMEQGLAEHVTLVGQPSYDGIEGGQGELYSSAILMRRREGSIAAPVDGRPLIPLDIIRGKRFAYNSLDSMSGIIALLRDLESMGESLEILSARIKTGAHRASIAAVADSTADVCAIDCRSWALAQRHEPRAAELRVVGWTGRRKGLPYIAARGLSDDVVETIRRLI